MPSPSPVTIFGSARAVASRRGEHDVMPVIAHCAPWDAAFRRIEIARCRNAAGR